MALKASEPSLLKALEARELGYCDRNNFSCKFSSASSTVRRLECQGSLKGHHGCVNTVSFSSDGQIVLTGSDDCKLILHDVGSLKRLSTVHSGHDHNVFGAQFVPEKGVDEAITCAADGFVRHVILARGDTKLPSSNGTSRVLVEHDDMANRIVLDPCFPTCLYSAGGDGVIYGIDLRIGGRAGIRRVATASFIYKNTVGDSEPAKRPLSLHALDACPATGDLYIGGTSNKLYRIDPRYSSTYDIVYELKLQHDDELETTCSSLYPRGRTSSLSASPHNVNWYETTMKRNLVVMTGCSVSYDGSEVLVTFNDDLVYLLNTSKAKYSEESGPQKRSFSGQRNDLTYKGVSFFGPRSEYVVSGSDCGHVYIWSKEDGKLQAFLFADETGPVNCLAPHPHLPILATSGYAYDAKVWAPTRETLINHEPEAMIGNHGLSAAHWMEVNSVVREHSITVLPISIVSSDSESSSTGNSLLGQVL